MKVQSCGCLLEQVVLVGGPRDGEQVRVRPYWRYLIVSGGAYLRRESDLGAWYVWTDEVGQDGHPVARYNPPRN